MTVSVTSFVFLVMTGGLTVLASFWLGLAGGSVGLGAGRQRSRDIGTRMPLSSNTKTVSKTSVIKYGPTACGRIIWRC